MTGPCLCGDPLCRRCFPSALFCGTCGDKGFVNADGSINNAFIGPDADDDLKPCPECVLLPAWVERLAVLVAEAPEIIFTRRVEFGPYSVMVVRRSS